MSRRIWLIFKIIFKIGALIFGMCIYALWIVDLFNISVIDDNRLIAIFKSAASIPTWELIKSYAQNMFFQGEHAASMIFPCMIMSIPLLRLIITVLFKGLVASFALAKENLMVTYVYVDSGKFAYEEVNSETLLILAFSILVRILLVGVIINISPFILLITLPINVIQLFWVKRR